MNPEFLRVFKEIGDRLNLINACCHCYSIRDLVSF